MVLTLHTIGTKKKIKKRYGRGNASGHGTFSGRGSKGQRSRYGGKKGLALKGFRKNMLAEPKFKGMKSPRPIAQVVVLSMLEKNFADGEKVTPGTLLAKKLVDNTTAPIKILLNKKDSSITKKVEIFGCKDSVAAKALIEKAGGKILDAEVEEAK